MAEGDELRAVVSSIARHTPPPVKPIARALYYAVARAGFALSSPLRPINKRPILVLGNQKSGTTAIAALLAEMTGLSVTLDLTLEEFRPSYERLRSGDMSFEQFVRRNQLSFSRQIVKEPGLTVFYKELAALFPAARFVYVLRDPRDNIRSILNRLGLPGNLPRLSQRQWSAVPYVWRLVLDGRWLGLRGNNYIEMLAARWGFLADLYAANQERMYLVRYEQFRRDKTGVLARLAAELDLPRRRDITESLDRPFQPAGDSSVSWWNFFGRDNLDRISRVCGARMARFGYEPHMKRAAGLGQEQEEPRS
jgi:hypothetical protein